MSMSIASLALVGGAFVAGALHRITRRENYLALGVAKFAPPPCNGASRAFQKEIVEPQLRTIRGTSHRVKVTPPSF